MNRRAYTKPSWEELKLPHGINILETLSVNSTTDDFDWGGNLGGDDWVDDDGEFL